MLGIQTPATKHRPIIILTFHSNSVRTVLYVWDQVFTMWWSSLCRRLLRSVDNVSWCNFGFGIVAAWSRLIPHTACWKSALSPELMDLRHEIREREKYFCNSMVFQSVYIRYKWFKQFYKPLPQGRMCPVLQHLDCSWFNQNNVDFTVLWGFVSYYSF